LIGALERAFLEKGPTDPLIARSLERPLSNGEEALFIVDGHHRLLAAAATDVAELRVYVGKPRPRDF
jgi:ParB-like chromosome segregation protein Spo0J